MRVTGQPSAREELLDGVWLSTSMILSAGFSPSPSRCLRLWFLFCVSAAMSSLLLRALQAFYFFFLSSFFLILILRSGDLVSFCDSEADLIVLTWR